MKLDVCLFFSWKKAGYHTVGLISSGGRTPVEFCHGAYSRHFLFKHRRGICNGHTPCGMQHLHRSSSRPTDQTPSPPPRSFGGGGGGDKYYPSPDSNPQSLDPECSDLTSRPQHFSTFSPHMTFPLLKVFPQPRPRPPPPPPPFPLHPPPPPTHPNSPLPALITPCTPPPPLLPPTSPPRVGPRISRIAGFVHCERQFPVLSQHTPPTSSAPPSPPLPHPLSTFTLLPPPSPPVLCLSPT